MVGFLRPLCTDIPLVGVLAVPRLEWLLLEALFKAIVWTICWL